MRVCLIEDKPGLGSAGQSLSVEDATGAAWIADGTARVADNCGDPAAWNLQAQRDKSAALTKGAAAPPAAPAKTRAAKGKKPTPTPVPETPKEPLHSKDNPPPPATRPALHK